jgi:hypothetical protein
MTRKAITGGSFYGRAFRCRDIPTRDTFWEIGSDERPQGDKLG